MSEWGKRNSDGQAYKKSYLSGEQTISFKPVFIHGLDDAIADEAKAPKEYQALIEKAGILYGSDSSIVRTLEGIKADEIRHHGILTQIRSILVGGD